MTRVDLRRRALLKAGMLAGLSAGSPLLLTACGGSDDDGDAPPPGPREARHLHFDLSGPAMAGARLHALRSRHHKALLQPHDDETRALHRQLNPALAAVPDERLTHFLADADLPAEALQSVVVMGRDPATGAPVLGGLHLAIPTTAREAVQRQRAARGEAGPRSAKPGLVGREPPLARAGESVQDVPRQLDAYLGPFDVATFLVFHHPEVMNLDPQMGTEIVDRIQALPCGDDPECVPYIGTLAEAVAQRIASVGYPGTTPGSWCTLVAQTDADGVPLTDPDGDPVWRFELDDDIARLTGTVVRQVLQGIFDDPMFEGANWHATTGLGSVAGVAAAAAPASARPRPRAVAQAAADVFDIAADHPPGATLNGIETVALAVTDAGQRSVRLTVRNRYLRFLSTYVQFFDANGVALPVQDPVDGDSDRAKFLKMVTTNSTIMGVPFQGNDVATSDLDFSFPASAASATVMFGSLGLGGDAFTKEAVMGSLLTLGFNIGLPTIMLALGVKIDLADIQADIRALMYDQTTLLEVVRNVLASISKSGPGLVDGIYSSGVTQSVEPFLTGVATAVIQGLLANAPKLVARLAALQLSTWMFQVGCPFAAVAFKVLAVLADLAALGVCLGEVLSSTAITTHSIALKMRTTVRIARDPADFQFPASARRYELQACYDGGATPRTASGSIAPGTVDPIEVLLDDVPSGGRVTFKVSLYSDDGCLVGLKLLDPIDNLPDTAGVVELEITELLAALTAQTVYQHDLKLAYAGGQRLWQAGPAPQATQAALCAGQDGAVCALNGLTVHTPSGMAGYGYDAGGTGLADCNGNPAAALNTVQNLFLGQQPDRALKQAGCGTSEPIGIVYDALGPAVGGHHFIVQPAADGFHLRRVRLDTQSVFDQGSSLSWGRFSSALDSLVVMPSGWVVGVNRTSHKMEILQLPLGAVDQSVAPQSVPFAAIKAGIGTRAGLLDTPVAVAGGPGNAVLVLEQGNRRVQAFDIAANPLPLFAGGTSNLMPLDDSIPDAVYLDLAVEGAGHVYVLSYVFGGGLAAHYRLDLHAPDGSFLARTTGVAAARIAVDLFRNLYTLNYEALAGAPTVEPTLSQWLPVTPDACPANLAASATRTDRAACAPARSSTPRA